MSDRNKESLKQANAAILAGDHEGFLVHCHEDVIWTTVGEGSLNGKASVRRWMQENYRTPPRFEVRELVSEHDTVVAIGTIEIEVDGAGLEHDYCDVWRFRDGKMAELLAFVIPKR